MAIARNICLDVRARRKFELEIIIGFPLFNYHSDVHSQFGMLSWDRVDMPLESRDQNLFALFHKVPVVLRISQLEDNACILNHDKTKWG